MKKTLLWSLGIFAVAFLFLSLVIHLWDVEGSISIQETISVLVGVGILMVLIARRHTQWLGFFAGTAMVFYIFDRLLYLILILFEYELSNNEVTNLATTENFILVFAILLFLLRKRVFQPKNRNQ